MSLRTFAPGYRAMVFGAGGGIGAALAAALADDPACAVVHAGARRAIDAGAKLAPFRLDLDDEASIAAAVESAAADGPLDLVIVATGVLHGPGLAPEKTWRAIEAGALAKAFAVNAIGPALIAKHALARLPTDRKAVFAALSAKVGSISDNRSGGWHAYRASKAALNQIVRGLAIELASRRPQAICVALHPGTVATGLSAPFARGASGLVDPPTAAARLLEVIDGLTSADSGRLIGWDGTEIAP